MNITNCPICKGKLQIKEYHCESCEVSFKGDFSSPWSDQLSPQQMEFVRLFLIVQGNIKEMEKRLSISYPTVKNRLAEIIRQISEKDKVTTTFDDIFNDLEEGFIGVDEAINMIEQRRNQ